jgi:hypothetical protein
MLVRSRIKPYLIFFSAIILAGGGAYFWGLRSSMLKIEERAKQSIEKAEEYDALKQMIEKEKTRCLEFLSQQEGNFVEYSYCQKLVDWLKTL